MVIENGLRLYGRVEPEHRVVYRQFSNRVLFTNG